VLILKKMLGYAANIRPLRSEKLSDFLIVGEVPDLLRICLYLAKYIGKQEKGSQRKLETDINERCFSASPGITIPETVYKLKYGVNKEVFALEIVETIGGRLGFVRSQEESGGNYGWACSWC
jgi:hypothetical protein